MGLGKTGASGEDQHDSGIDSCGLASFVQIFKSVVGNHKLAQGLEQVSDVNVLFRDREGKFEKPFCREIFKSLPLSAVTVSDGAAIRISDGRAPSAFATTAPDLLRIGAGQRAAARREV